MTLSLSRTTQELLPAESFVPRHIGPNNNEIKAMLAQLGAADLDTFINQIVPSEIRLGQALDLPQGLSEQAALGQLHTMAQKNKIFRSLMGMGYYDTITPPVIQRNILENPGWYTAYTPYQAEIAQGRLEALLNFQTLIIELTGMEIANASLLDEATAAAEAMTMSYGLTKGTAQRFLVSDQCHPQVIAVVQTRALPLGIEVIVQDHRDFSFSPEVFGALIAYPASNGQVYDYQALTHQAHEVQALITVTADLLALTLLTPPGAWGADIVVGSAQRLGVPLGYGGPHAAFFATRDRYKRQIPGRIVGVSQDVHGNPALRLALQTREQHIRRDKATSNICTAQVLLAVMAGMYAVYHGPVGLKQIAQRIHQWTVILATGLRELGFDLAPGPYFDTLHITVGDQTPMILGAALNARINVRVIDGATLGISLDECTTPEEVAVLWQIFNGGEPVTFTVESILRDHQPNFSYALPLARTCAYLTQPIFNRYHSETEFLRYLYRLQSKDLALNTSMIPLGSCTMKLNATAEMLPVSWAEFSKLHPFAPLDQVEGYQQLFSQLEQQLATITGFSAVSLQPNAGSQGEYTGLLVIRAYHQAQGQRQRKICLIPQSAHGTNPASAVMCGFNVVAVACDPQGNIDLRDLEAKALAHSHELAALMITYPSTHGVFEATIRQVCTLIHSHGGQVYMDGANMNAQVGLCRPGDMGADVCHLNLHKTFCIPHGGGGPGMGPIGVAHHLAPFLPGHPVMGLGGPQAIGAVSAAAYGSASILPISWMYMVMMGSKGLTEATKIAILNANYLAQRLDPYFPILYRGETGWVAHECIIDLRPLKKQAGIEVDDVAKRLMDYGFHAPTVSWPVAGTMMIEPTESESKAELDRFCEALIAIYHEAMAIAGGLSDPHDNPLKNAPHTALSLMGATWDHPYSREQAAYPLPWLKDHKFWPVVGRIDNAYGDRNLICSCVGMEAFS